MAGCVGSTCPGFALLSVLGMPVHEVAYEEYKKATTRSLEAFYKKAKALGYRWPRGSPSFVGGELWV